MEWQGGTWESNRGMRESSTRLGQWIGTRVPYTVEWQWGIQVPTTSDNRIICLVCEITQKCEYV